MPLQSLAWDSVSPEGCLSSGTGVEYDYESVEPLHEGHIRRWAKEEGIDKGRERREVLVFS